MKEPYLWDPNQEADPEIEALEKALEPYRWKGKELHSELPPVGPGRPAVRRRLHPATWAAALLFIVSVWSLTALRGRNNLQDYSLAVLSGTVEVDGKIWQDNGLGLGQRIRSEARSRARLDILDIGSVVLEPETSLRLENPEGWKESQGAQHMLYLEQGRISATIFAPPRLFQVATTAGRAVDLGCMYTAEVDAEGWTVLEVVSGWVAFEAPEWQLLLPFGAGTKARPGELPQVPVWTREADHFRPLLAPLEAGDADPAALHALLEACDHQRHSLMLWHLLGHPKLAKAHRQPVAERLRQWQEPPEEVSWQACLQGEAAALSVWMAEFSWAF